MTYQSYKLLRKDLLDIITYKRSCDNPSLKNWQKLLAYLRKDSRIKLNIILAPLIR